MRRECRERFPRHRGLASPTCITARASRTHVPSSMPGSQTSGRWWGKRSRHFQRMRNTQFYVSGKRPIYYYSRKLITPFSLIKHICCFTLYNALPICLLNAPSGLFYSDLNIAFIKVSYKIVICYQYMNIKSSFMVSDVFGAWNQEIYCIS